MLADESWKRVAADSTNGFGHFARDHEGHHPITKHSFNDSKGFTISQKPCGRETSLVRIPVPADQYEKQLFSRNPLCMMLFVFCAESKRYPIPLLRRQPVSRDLQAQYLIQNHRLLILTPWNYADGLGEIGVCYP
jgi:hypothetical protein